MAHCFAVLGAGRQGTAAGYAFARFFGAERVLMVDSRESAAKGAAARINDLLSREVAVARVVDALSVGEVTAALGGARATLSALPYPLNPGAARAAIAAGSHFTDLGGNTAIVEDELRLDLEARSSGVSVVPDSGLAPGLSNALAALVLQRLPGARHVRAWCGGLPASPEGPLGYKLVFHIGGLTNEYTGEAELIRGGRVRKVAAMSECEEVTFPAPVGRAEAFLTSGGTSTCPRTWAGRLDSFEYKTVRYPGHFAMMRPLVALGFLSTEPVEVGGLPVVPRELAHALLAPLIDFPHTPDLVVLRVRGRVDDEGDAAIRPDAAREIRFELIDHADPTTGFSAMERCTAFPAAALAYLQAEGGVDPGARSLEVAFDPERYFALLEQTGLVITATTATAAAPLR